MKLKLCLAAFAATSAVALPVAADAQTRPTYTVPTCPTGQVNSTTAPYYCISSGGGDDDGGGGGKSRIRTVGIKAKPKVDRSAPYAYTVSGTVKRGASARSARVRAQASARSLKSKVKITVKRGKKVVATKNAKVSKSGKYKAKVKIATKKLKGAKGTLKITARYKGNGKFRAKSSKAIKVRYIK